MVKRFIIFGAGAVGSTLGGLLIRNGYGAVLIGRKRHIDVINSRGLMIKKEKEEFYVKIDTVTDLKEVVFKSGDVILLTVKSAQTKDFVEIAKKSYLDKDIPVCAVQNGMNNEEELAKYFKNVYGGIVKMTCAMLEPGEVMFKREGRIIIGRYPSGSDKTAEEMVRIFTNCGFKTTVSGKIVSDRYLKLLVNLINLPVSIVKKEYHEKPKFLNLQKDLLTEGIKVLAKAGIDYSPDSDIDLTAKDMIEKLERSEPFYHSRHIMAYVSTWQDLYYKRKPLECTDFYQTIVDLGKNVNIDTPYNKKMFLLSKIAAEKEFSPEIFDINEFFNTLNSISI
ncbi:ketopantoate reductase family protein [candidate division KSB1 bacterium]